MNKIKSASKRRLKTSSTTKSVISKPKARTTNTKTDKIKHGNIGFSIEVTAIMASQLQKMIVDIASKEKKTGLLKELSLARNHIANTVINEKQPKQDSCNLSYSYFISTLTTPGYCTLDAEHIADIQAIADNINKYTDDPSLKRPLNVLMLASPGAGKSHFINCIARKLKDKGIVAVIYNMAAMERNDDLIQPFDAARNLKVQDHLPLLFLDEFDSNPKNYATLLPLLWDGEIHLGHRDLRLGKAVIILAGSRPDLPKTLEMAKNMQLKNEFNGKINTDTSKIVDLLSRINGGMLNIPSLNLVQNGRDRRIDKICIAISLLQSRFGDQLAMIPKSLLRFVAIANFRYGVRSIAHLINLIPNKSKQKLITTRTLKLPLDNVNNLKKSSLAYHLIDEDQAHGIVEKWKVCTKNDVQLLIGLDALKEAHIYRMSAT